MLGGGERLQRQNTHIGIAFLKMLMYFEVVCCHFWICEKEYVPAILVPIYILKDCAVPVFMTLSFYFYYKYLDKMNFSILLVRIKRLYIPQVAWAVIYWGVFMLMELVFHLERLHGLVPLFWQIVTGHSRELNPSMWYQFDLIVLTAIVSLLAIKLKGAKTLLVLFALCMISVMMQSTGINVKIFGDMAYELKYPLGRLAEMIPYAFLGLAAFRYQVLHRLKTHRYPVMLSAAGVMILLAYLYWNGYVGQLKGFSYAGAFLFVMTVCLITIAYLFPNDSNCPEKIRRLSEKVTQFTLGIYCMHRLVGTIMKLAVSFLDLEINSFLLCIIVYAVSYYVAYTVSKFFPVAMQRLVD